MPHPSAPPPFPGAIDPYSLTWTRASRDSTGSMPVGNGDIGLNVWVEEGGDLLFLVGKTDAWSETGRLLKLGRIRVSCTPNPFHMAPDPRVAGHARLGPVVGGPPPAPHLRRSGAGPGSGRATDRPRSGPRPIRRTIPPSSTSLPRSRPPPRIGSVASNRSLPRMRAADGMPGRPTPTGGPGSGSGAGSTFRPRAGWSGASPR